MNSMMKTEHQSIFPVMPFNITKKAKSMNLKPDLPVCKSDRNANADFIPEAAPAGADDIHEPADELPEDCRVVCRPEKTEVKRKRSGK